ncbi:MAG: ABC transporter permease [Actinobacteria bacterium]|nr:ABC transporter permease [Actinomycetota bacterium]
MSRVSELVERRELLVHLTLRELRSRYKKSVLGWTWSLLNPLASVIIYWLVFSVFLEVEPPIGEPSGLQNFVLYLLCGLVLWNFFAGCVNLSLDAFLGNANLIKKVYFPRELLVVSGVASLLVSLFIEVGVLSVILLIAGNMVIPWLPVAIFQIAVLTVFVIGIGLFLSVANVYFRDVKHFVAIAMQALFYSAPIVYPISVVPDEVDFLGREIPIGEIYRLNPLVHFIENFRAVLYDLRFPPLRSTLYLVAWALVVLVLGWRFFTRHDGRLPEEV